MAEKLINTDSERTWNDVVMDKIHANNSTVSVPTEMAMKEYSLTVPKGQRIK